MAGPGALDRNEELFFEQVSPSLLRNKALRTYLSSYTAKEWPEALKLTLLYGLLALCKRHPGKQLSVQELREVVAGASRGRPLHATTAAHTAHWLRLCRPHTPVQQHHLSRMVAFTIPFHAALFCRSARGGDLGGRPARRHQGAGPPPAPARRHHLRPLQAQPGEWGPKVLQLLLLFASSARRGGLLWGREVRPPVTRGPCVASAGRRGAGAAPELRRQRLAGSTAR